MRHFAHILSALCFFCLLSTSSFGSACRVFDTHLVTLIGQGPVWFVPTPDRLNEFYGVRDHSILLIVTLNFQAKKQVNGFALAPQNYRLKIRNLDNPESDPIIVKYNDSVTSGDERTLIFKSSSRDQTPARYTVQIRQRWGKIRQGPSWINQDAVLFHSEINTP